MKILFAFAFLLGSSFFNLASAQTEEPFTYVEKMPEFPGGQLKMYEYIYQELEYPLIAKRHNVSGLVLVQFVVEKDGTLGKIKVVRGVDTSLDEEAMRVVESMNDGYKWTPGIHNGTVVPVTFTLPIKFVL